MYPSRIELAAKLALCEENSTGASKISRNIVGNPNAHLAILIQLDILIQKHINLITPFYYEISNYSQSILANIVRTKQL